MLLHEFLSACFLPSTGVPTFFIDGALEMEQDGEKEDVEEAHPCAVDGGGSRGRAENDYF